MSIKSFDDLKFEGTVCQFIGVDEVIEATSDGYTLRCALKPSVEFAGAYVAEVWAYDPALEKDELQGVMAVLPNTAVGDIQVLRGKTLDELKDRMRQIVGNNIYARLHIADEPTAAAASWCTDNKIVLDLARQGALH